MFKPAQSYSSPTIYSKTYNKFRGVDFTSDPSKVAAYRSPDAVNMIPDAGGMPEKRVGWRSVKRIGEMVAPGGAITYLPVVAMYHSTVPNRVKTEVYGDTLHLHFAQASTGIYVWCSELGIERGLSIPCPLNKVTFFSILTGMIDEYGNADLSGESLFAKTSRPCFLTGGFINVIVDAYINIHGEQDALEIDWMTVADGVLAYAPITSIDRAPCGAPSTPYEPINLFTPIRRNWFKGDGTTRDFLLDAPIDLEFDLLQATDLATGDTFEVTVKNAETGEISFTTAPPMASGPDDNIQVLFRTVANENAPDLRKCTLAANFTAGSADNRLILSGHPDYPNYEWYSASNEGLYFPDINYNIVGLGSSAIKGYCDYGQYQVIVKEGDGTPNAYLRSYTEDNDGELVFTLTQGNVSADALGATSTLNGQPLFLSSSGVIGLVSTAVKSDTAFNNVSYFINSKLVAEPNLERAFAVHHKQKVYIFVNSHVYILDGTQNKAYIEAAVDDYSYECFYWENVPATCAVSDGETIWFGTEDGYICRFNNDLEEDTKYNDYDISGVPVPVTAYWCTPLDYDDSVGIAKTLVRKGSTLILKPALKTGADVYIRTNDSEYDLVASFDVGMPSIRFDAISFGDFAFTVAQTEVAPKNLQISVVVKNYSFLQFKIQNDKLSQPFGIYGVTKYFKKGRYE